VTHFHHSPLATNELVKRQKQMKPNDDAKKLIQHCKTRWNWSRPKVSVSEVSVNCGIGLTLASTVAKKRTLEKKNSDDWGGTWPRATPPFGSATDVLVRALSRHGSGVIDTQPSVYTRHLRLTASSAL